MNLLLQLLQDHMKPWVENGEYCLLTPEALKNSTPAKGVRVTRNQMRGERRAVRNQRDVDGAGAVMAAWADDHLIEARYPKMVCIVGGQADLMLGDRVVHSGPGTFILLPPGTPHPGGPGTPVHLDAGRRGPDDYCDLLWFMLLRQKVLCWLCHSRCDEHSLARDEHWMLLEKMPAQLFAMLAEEAESGRARSDDVVQNLLLAFLGTVQRELKSERYLQPGPMLPAEAEQSLAEDDPVRQAQAYMRANLHQSLTIQSVARQVFLSRSELAARLRAETGRSFLDLLTDYRMQEAQSLLRDTGWTVTCIGEFVGFKSLAHFHVLFKQQLGVTPGQFRSQHKSVKK